jgi:hypothetical protein
MSNFPSAATWGLFIICFIAGYCTSLLSAGKQMVALSENWNAIGWLDTRTFNKKLKTAISGSVFDVLYEEVYYDTINNSSGMIELPSLRTKFSVNEWEGKNISSGGLVESDRVLLGSMYYDAISVFEFGLGESTQIAAYVGVPRYSGIDSDPNWVVQARDKVNKAHYKFYLADIGQTGPWGYPIAKLRKIPLNYQFQALHIEMEPFDVYLVDGRYRVACVMASFLHAISRKADIANTRVLIHDAHRDGYQVVLEIAEVIDESDNLYVLRLKENITEAQIASIWRNHMYTNQR